MNDTFNSHKLIFRNKLEDVSFRCTFCGLQRATILCYDWTSCEEAIENNKACVYSDHYSYYSDNCPCCEEEDLSYDENDYDNKHLEVYFCDEICTNCWILKEDKPELD